MSMTSDMKMLGASIAAMVGVAIVSVMGILVLNGFKNTTLSTTTTNTTIDNFILGIAVFTEQPKCI